MLRRTGPCLCSSHHEAWRKDGHSWERETESGHRGGHTDIVRVGGVTVRRATGSGGHLTFWATEAILLGARGDWSTFASGVGCDTSADSCGRLVSMILTTPERRKEDTHPWTKLQRQSQCLALQQPYHFQRLSHQYHRTLQ